MKNKPDNFTRATIEAYEKREKGKRKILSDALRLAYAELDSFEYSFSEWLDEKQARDDARGLETEPYTSEEAGTRRSEQIE
jgi:hypothetical protein